MSNLVAFVRARLDEDERLARACQDEIGTLRAGEPFLDGSGVAERDDYPSYPWGSRDRELAFMAAFNPARALREVAAKRRTIERHEAHEGRCVVCCSVDPDGGWDAAPCGTIRNLTETWSNHPDYDPAWAG